MDEQEFDDFYVTGFARLTGQIYAMIGDREEAEECVQEAFIRAWANRRQLELANHPEAWVRTTAYRLAVSRWRRLKLGRRPADRAVSPAVSAPPPDENRVALVRALNELPDAQRRALVLHHICDLPVQQIAEETGVPAGTVKARLSRGRVALAALLESRADGIPGGATHA